jgi:benzoate membrane transport protein
MRRLKPRYAVVAALGVGIAIAALQNQIQFDTVALQLAIPS